MNLLGDPTYVLDLVSRHYAVSVEEIRGPIHTGRQTWARQVAMYVMHRHGGMGLHEIGRVLNRDHTTVWHGVHKVERRVRIETLERDRLDDALADTRDAAVVLAVTNQTLKEARALVKRLEAVACEVEAQLRHPTLVVA